MIRKRQFPCTTTSGFGLAVFLSILAALRVGTSTVEDRKIPIFFVCIILALLVGFSFVGPRKGNFYRFFGWMAVALIPSALLVGYASEKRLLGPAVAVCMAIATVMSLSNLVFRNYGMHSYRLVITPRAAYPDPSGCRLFRANFDFCDICEKWTEITDIQVSTRAVQSDSNTSPYCTSSDPGLFLKVPHSDAAAAKDDTGGYNIEIIVQTDKGREISLTRVIPVSTSDTPKVPTPFWVHE